MRDPSERIRISRIRRGVGRKVESYDGNNGVIRNMIQPQASPKFKLSEFKLTEFELPNNNYLKTKNIHFMD